MITVDLLDEAQAQYSPTGDEIRAERERVANADPAELSSQEQFERRREMIAATAIEPIADAFERLIGGSQLLPINYLLLGYLQSQSVGRIRYFDRREGKEAVATGFLISENLLMTNHHVFPVQNAAEFDAFAKDAVVEFNYQYDLDGNRSAPVEFQLEPQRFVHTAKPLDMALVAVHPTDTTGLHFLKNQGYLVLDGSLGKAVVGDFASIIQHPSGKEKQIAIRKNEIINIDLPDALIYVSDTAQGSSGAPVFNDQWQVIALHSAGVAKKNADGQFIDKNGEVVEPVNGRVDEDRLVWESNRGIRVSAMMASLRAVPGLATDPLVQQLFSPAYTDSRPYAALSRPHLDVERTTFPAASDVAATPVVPVTPTAPINININIGPGGPVVTTATGAAMVAPSEAAIAFERQTFEDRLDFSECAGFDDRFMGVHIPMPKPNASLRKKLAFLKDSPTAYTLKYHHISTLHHAVRRVPIVSGVNVNGKKRFSNLSGVNKWFRDNRIDYDVQLNEDFYDKSGFDKGHLARREDAEWGSTAAAALAAADLTCSYANAVPQVPALNRAVFGFTGEWGQLEIELLERGVENEPEKASRICVFNGPLFDNDDPVFKGVQVAVSFYKVVVWYDGDENLRTTCYVLSQENLVGEIEFEVLRFDDIFTTAQVPIRQIEKTTGLKFPAVVVDNDTYNG
jgi:endonuclease G